MVKQYEIIRIPSTKKKWTLPKESLNEFGLRENEEVILKWGSATNTVIVSQTGCSLSKTGLSEKALQTLGIPQYISVKIKALGPKSFRLGPLIGILTFSSYVPDKLYYYDRWLRYNNQGGFLYFFRGQDMMAREQKIVGYYQDLPTREWKQGIFPFPDVVIDRCYPNVDRYHALLEKVIGPGKIFNKKNLISKTDFHKALSADSFLKNFVPETKLFRSFSDLTVFLEKYGQAFLKPTRAMKGTGIVVATKKPNGIECTYTSSIGTISKIIDSAAQLPDILKASGGKNKKYIIQQSIRSIQYQGGPLSFRVNPMKNGQNKWVVPGLVPLSSMGSGYTTNYASGGQTLPLEELFSAILPRLACRKEVFLGVLTSLSIRAAAVLDKTFGPLGDLGIDLIIDTKGKPWLLEANGNTAKIAAFVQNDFPDWRKLVYQYPLDYATYLAGFN